MIETVAAEKQPGGLICGHIHDGRGYAVPGQTVVVNSAPGRDSEGCIIELDGDRAPEVLMI